jgi:chromate transporter
MSDIKNLPTLKETFYFWFKLGFISFGGPAGHVALMHQFLVDEKKWISNSRFLHALNYCMLLPGPEATQLATYIGWLLHGRIGGIIAGLLFIIPSMFILIGLSIIYVLYGDIPQIEAIFNGLKPAVIAIVLFSFYKISNKSLHNVIHYIIAAASFICMYFLNIPFPAIILTAVVLAILLEKFAPEISRKSNEKQNEINLNDEENYVLNSKSSVTVTPFSTLKVIRQIAFFFLIWLAPIIVFYFFTSDFEFWKNISLFFTKTAFITFGGAYAVLPYVAEFSVEKLNWLSNHQMIDGLALGETTPGPLIMVLAFVGFMAGYNLFGFSLVMGILASIVTVFYTFLPCFLFIFVGAPIIENTRNDVKIINILNTISAAVVGVILNLAFYLGVSVLFPQEISLDTLNIPSLIWLIVSLIALIRFQVNMITWIGISCLFGLLSYFIF